MFVSDMTVRRAVKQKAKLSFDLTHLAQSSPPFEHNLFPLLRSTPKTASVCMQTMTATSESGDSFWFKTTTLVSWSTNI